MSIPRRRRSVKAQGLVEYALILSLVAIVAVAILSVLGSSVSTALCNTINTLKSSPEQCTTSGAGTGSSSGGTSNLILTITQVNSQHAFYAITDANGATVPATVTASDTAHLVLTCANNKCSNPPAQAFPHGDVITISATYNGTTAQASITYP